MIGAFGGAQCIHNPKETVKKWCHKIEKLKAQCECDVVKWAKGKEENLVQNIKNSNITCTLSLTRTKRRDKSQIEWNTRAKKEDQKQNERKEKHSWKT